ncbi:MAG: transglycosylase SLT domain-containing protein [Clostridia bacterium]|nr:transglycosylase SLT domain-containing protein [Clostridia bacterium]
MILFPCLMHSPGDDLYPASPQVDEYGIPDNPFAPPAETQQPSPRRRRAERSAQEMPTAPVQQPVQPVQPAYPAQPVQQPARPVQPAQPVYPAQPAAGAQFQPPVSPEIPDWLRTAQQNNMPLPNRPQGPRVQAAPRHPQPQGMRPAGQQQPLPPMRPRQAAQGMQPYGQQMNYPQQNAPLQRRTPQQPPAQPYAQQMPYQPQEPPIQRRRVPQQEAPQPAYPEQDAPIQRRRTHMTPENDRHLHSELQEDGWRVADDGEEVPREVPYWIKRIPWLGIAAFAAVAIAVALWIMGINYQNQLEDVLEARAAKEAQLVENHPLKYEELIEEKADKYNLAPAYVAAIMLNESSFRPQATAETTGARGLMQLVSPTAEWIHSKLAPGTPFDFGTMYDAETNAEYGCWYLNYLSEMFGGDPVLVTAAYHAGQTEVRNWLDTDAYSPDGKTIAIDKIPITATRRYVARVLNAYAAYLRIHYGG